MYQHYIYGIYDICNESDENNTSDMSDTSNMNSNENDAYYMEIRDMDDRQNLIELKPYSNDKYSDNNIIILIGSNKNISETRKRGDKNEEYERYENDWIVIS